MKTYNTRTAATLLFNLLLVLFFRAQSPATPLGQQVTPADEEFKAPTIVTNKFNTEYPNTSANWVKTGDHYAAEFLNNTTQTKKVVVYDNYGNTQYYKQELTADEIPKPIKSYVRTNYPDDKVTVWKQEDMAKNLFYFAPLKNDTLRFDNNGKRTTSGR